MSFTELGLQKTLATRLLNLGYISPGPAHKKTIPAILRGDSLFIISPLGAGFTESALLSIINLSAEQPQSDQTYIILSASKDHNHIIEQRLKLLVGDDIAINISTNLEGSFLPKHQPSIWVSTAKELHDHFQNTQIVGKTSCTLLLTETDEMIARGSKPDLLALSDYLSNQCQVIICTSRITKSINSISASLQHNPKRYKLNTNIQEPASIAQQAWPVPENMKSQLLSRLSSKLHNDKVIVMVRNNQTASRLARRMRTRRIKASAVRSVNKLDTFSRFETDDIKMLIVSERADNSMPVENVKYVVHYHLPDSTNGYLDILNKTPDSVHMSLIAPGEEEQLIEIEDMLKRPILRNILTNFDYGKQVTNPRKKKKRSKRKKTPQTKTVWDPEVPRTWGDPNAPRSIPEKIPLETWSPSPLPSIWLGEDKKRTVKDLSWSPGPLPSIWLEEDKKRTVKGMSGSKQSHRRRKKYNRKRNGNKTSRYKKQ